MFHMLGGSGVLLTSRSGRAGRRSDRGAAPLAPLASGVGRDSLSNITLPKFGPGDF